MAPYIGFGRGGFRGGAIGMFLKIAGEGGFGPYISLVSESAVRIEGENLPRALEGRKNYTTV